MRERLAALLPSLALLVAFAACRGRDLPFIQAGDALAADETSVASDDVPESPSPDGTEESTAGAPTDEDIEGGMTLDPAALLAPAMHRSCPSCARPEEGPISLVVSPARPVAGHPLRIFAVADHELDVERLTVEDDDGTRPLAPIEAWGGPPWAWAAMLEAAPAGRPKLCLIVRGPEASTSCVRVDVLTDPPPAEIPLGSGVWPIERGWDRSAERIYSAWIARLFLTEPGMSAGWRPLHQATRDRQRNLLWNHLGLGEDEAESPASVAMAPDCGDTPYFLRAYFAWKMRLPFAAHLCPRGDPGEGPGCDGRYFTNLAPAFDDVADPVERFNRFLADALARWIHSGTARTLPEDEFSDFYPLELSRAALRPGTIFVDPRGHLMVLTRWLPGTEDRIGTLFAIDGHPDQSITYKRFSPSIFFYSPKARTGGFKAFRPVVFEDGAFCFASNAELADDPPSTRYSLDQFSFPDAAAFHAHVAGLLNPYPPDPVLAFRDRMELLLELLVDRESAVRHAVEYMESTGWATVPIPDGAAIFATAGPWEDYASPARDLRLLIAADELLGFPQLVRESPGLFRMPEARTAEQLDADVAAAWEQGLRELSFAYTRSDGGSWTLTLGDFMDRLSAFELAYNPNDCPELRWAAPEASDELSTCSHRAPAPQRRLMAGYRGWFSARRQPSGP
ncbi:MAG: hypothetical protein HY905_20050 [Deltaproteobacteria bacterium]|nr:hypothetical protein [Deltaproteobacteria bacterium]